MARISSENVSRRKIASNTEEQSQTLRNKGLLHWTIRSGESHFSVVIGQDTDCKKERKEICN